MKTMLFQPKDGPPVRIRRVSGKYAPEVWAEIQALPAEIDTTDPDDLRATERACRLACLAGCLLPESYDIEREGREPRPRPMFDSLDDVGEEDLEWIIEVGWQVARFGLGVETEIEADVSGEADATIVNFGTSSDSSRGNFGDPILNALGTSSTLSKSSSGHSTSPGSPVGTTARPNGTPGNST